MIDIEGFDVTARDQIVAWCAEALEFLQARGEDLVVRPLTNAPPGAEASADSSEVRLALDLTRARRGGPPAWFMDLRLGYLIYEEVGHCLLHREGVPDSGEGEFFQELFASWAQSAALLATGRLDKKYLGTQPIPFDGPWYDLGKHAGAALAEMSDSKRRLREWANQPTSDSFKKELVTKVMKQMTVPLTAKAVAGSYRKLRRGKFGGR